MCEKKFQNKLNEAKCGLSVVFDLPNGEPFRFSAQKKIKI